MSDELTIEASRSFQTFARKMREADKSIRLETSKAIRVAVVPIVVELKADILAINSKVEGRSSSSSGEAARAAHAGSSKRQGRASHGLRAIVARAVQVRIVYAAGREVVQVRIDSSQLPPGQRNLPKALTARKWRHPTWGHEPWVYQVGSPGYWPRPFFRHAPAVRESILEAMRTVARNIKQ